MTGLVHWEKIKRRPQSTNQSNQPEQKEEKRQKEKKREREMRECFLWRGVV